MNNKLITGVILLAFAMSACDSRSATADNAIADSLMLELPLPEPPDDISEGKDKIAYILLHFWDTLDFKNDSRVHDAAFLEQNFSNFIAILPYAEADAGRRAVNRATALAAADPETLEKFAEVADLYLYEPNSPYYSEELYELFLEAFADVSGFDEAHSARYAYQLESVRKNRVGSKAADFDYVTADAKRHTLRNTPSKGKMMLVFYDIDCENCHAIIGQLKKDPRLTEAVKGGKLTVLAIYSGDDYTGWKSSLKEMPAEWTVGFENGRIDEDELYDFRSLPTVFLLDEDKTVVGKDVRLERFNFDNL